MLLHTYIIINYISKGYTFPLATSLRHIIASPSSQNILLPCDRSPQKINKKYMRRKCEITVLFAALCCLHPSFLSFVHIVSLLHLCWSRRDRQTWYSAAWVHKCLFGWCWAPNKVLGNWNKYPESIISPPALLGHFFPFMSPKMVSSALVTSALASVAYCLLLDGKCSFCHHSPKGLWAVRASPDLFLPCNLTHCPASLLRYSVLHPTGIQDVLQGNNLILTI